MQNHIIMYFIKNTHKMIEPETSILNIFTLLW